MIFVISTNINYNAYLNYMFNLFKIFIFVYFIFISILIYNNELLIHFFFVFLFNVINTLFIIFLELLKMSAKVNAFVY